MVTQLDSMDNTPRAERPVLGKRAIIKSVYMFSEIIHIFKSVVY